ncbi:MAG: PH domain-containing protein [Pseudoxanthomonas sp.]
MPLASTHAPRERRLHPWSWLFVLLQQLKQFIVPLGALLIFGGRTDRDEPWQHLASIIVVAVLVASALLRYLTYRYRIGEDGLTVRSGWLNRSVREIPFARIHNVGVHQSLLHRMFGVAEVRLESAGGNKPEAEMRVLSLEDALALEQQVRHRGTPPHAAPAHDAPSADTLLSLSPGEVVRLGLISNRGMLAVAAAFGATYQFFPERVVANFIEVYGRQAYGYASALHLGWMAGALTAFMLAALALVALRALSVLLALLQYHGFRLSEHQRRLTVERGLLTRLRTSVSRRRIQSWTLEEGVLHRVFGRRSLRVETAVAERQDQNARALKELAPLATPATCDGLVRHVLSGAQWPPRQWQAVPAGQWWRLSLPALCLIPSITAAAVWRWDHWGWLPLLWLPWSALKSYREMQRMGWSMDDALVAVRGGWWSRWWRFAEVAKLQALRLERSPLDRRFGTASLLLDTAGATSGAPALRIAFLPLAQAEQLHAALCQAMARQRLHW